MKEVIAVESRDRAASRELFKEWLNAHPDIARTLRSDDVTLEAARVEGGTLFRYRVRFEETTGEMTPEMRRKLAQESYEEKIRKVGKLIDLIEKKPKLATESSSKRRAE
jgi:hypothetical protein